MLKGRKTIVGSVAGALVMLAWSFSLIDEDAARGLLGLVLAWTGVSLRLAVRDAAKSNG